jgi:hypothetical protein
VASAAAAHAETLRRAQAICAEAEARADAAAARADAAERRAGRGEDEAAEARAETRRLEKELKARATAPYPQPPLCSGFRLGSAGAARWWSHVCWAEGAGTSGLRSAVLDAGEALLMPA